MLDKSAVCIENVDGIFRVDEDLFVKPELLFGFFAVGDIDPGADDVFNIFLFIEQSRIGPRNETLSAIFCLPIVFIIIWEISGHQIVKDCAHIPNLGRNQE